MKYLLQIAESQPAYISNHTHTQRERERERERDRERDQIYRYTKM
jgi:hypothetical protein